MAKPKDDDVKRKRHIQSILPYLRRALIDAQYSTTTRKEELRKLTVIQHDEKLRVRTLAREISLKETELAQVNRKLLANQ